MNVASLPLFNDLLAASITPEPVVLMHIQKLAVFGLDWALLDDRSPISGEAMARLREL
jgi:hypothetical protein